MLTSQTIILIVHICLVQAIRLPRAQAERAKVYFYKPWKSGNRSPACRLGWEAWLSRAGRRECEEAGAAVEPQGLWGSITEFAD